MPNFSGKVVAVRLMLLKEYLEANAGPDRIVTRGQIEAFLEEKGYKVEKKTFYSDRVLLDELFGLQLEYDEHKKGWYLLNPPFEPYELRLMVDGVQSSKFITKEKAQEITRKIKRMAGESVRDSLNRQTYVADRVRSMNDSVVQEADRIHQAIALDSKIGFRYFHYSPTRSDKRAYSKKGETVIVSPYAMMWNDGNYYLYAYDGKKFRNYRVDRMENIKPPLMIKRDGKELYHEKELTRQKEKVFRMYPGKETYTVRIRCLSTLADTVIDEFGKDTVLAPIDDNHFVFVAPVSVSPTFYAWVATFGRRMKILSPEPVVAGMRDFLQKAMDMYKDEG